MFYCSLGRAALRAWLKPSLQLCPEEKDQLQGCAVPQQGLRYWKLGEKASAQATLHWGSAAKERENQGYSREGLQRDARADPLLCRSRADPLFQEPLHSKGAQAGGGHFLAAQHLLL